MSIPQPAKRVGAEDRRQLIDDLKSRPCADCGNTFPAMVMEFDHARGRKRFEIGGGKYNSLGVVLTEVRKCDVVCSNCHTIRTHERRVRAHARFQATDWNVVVEVQLDRADALMVGQTLRSLSRDGGRLGPGTREIYGRVGVALLEAALAPLEPAE